MSASAQPPAGRSAARLLLPAALLALGLGGAIWPAARSGGANADAGGSARPAAPRVDWVAALESLPDPGLAPPSGSWTLALPADHGAHAGARTESWLLDGSLRDPAGEPIAFELALLRVALVSPDAPRRASAWATREVYRAHFTLAGDAEGEARGEERFARAAAGLAGDDRAAGRLWVESWSVDYGSGAGTLAVDADLPGAVVAIRATPAKPAVTLAGGGGDRSPFRGYALPRVALAGTIRRPSGEVAVTGEGRLEHLWGEVPMPVGPVAWDRLHAWLDDGTEISALRTRRRDGRGEPRSAAWRVDAGGRLEALRPERTAFEPAGPPWTDPATGARYPLRWRLAGDGVDLAVAPRLERQAHDFAVPVWSGAVSVHGRAGGRAVEGSGFLTLTGYGAEP